ncbi:hypothetical protein [Nocardia cerradoensis]|uniref:Uncharacterized protein n=1 Tax=Nocardia cerradoensis TaxID=85688 RepID=A0A231GTG2_9NOCA|nr:hypothetical protein [Nocardia cerradoensis]NKY48006.1 hypothetical protein [Nocardia cerradoensis]OXR39910.1 hypothetical protein B7C42_08015 [Nocardia cerradoensis]
MIIFTPEHIAAAKAVVNADAEVDSYRYDEPYSEGQEWFAWNDRLNAAQEAQDQAVAAFRALLGDLDPTDVAQGAPINPLTETLTEGVYHTHDHRFFASAYYRGEHAGKWAVDVYDPPIGEQDFRIVVRLVATDRQHAQQMVDLATWALGAGARTSEPVSAR